MIINSNLSKTFDLLRFPLAVLVVLLHIQPTIRIWDFDNLLQNNPSDRIYLTVNMIGCKLALCAVPTFFAISGYLLCFDIKQLTWRIYLKKLKNRIFTLFVPYIIWNILATGYLLVTKQIEMKGVSLAFMFLSPANFPLWFLRDLITMVVFFPVFYYLAKFLQAPGTILLTICFIFFPSHNIFSLSYLYISSLYFFYIGIIAGIKKIDLDRISSSFKCLIIGLFLFLLISSLYSRGYYDFYTQNLYLILAVMTVFVIAHWCVFHKGLTSIGILSSASFFIYCSHKLGPTFLSKLGFQYLNFDNSIIIFLFSPLITVAICIGLYYVLQRYCPFVLKILTGRMSKKRY